MIMAASRRQENTRIKFMPFSHSHSLRRIGGITVLFSNGKPFIFRRFMPFIFLYFYESMFIFFLNTLLFFLVRGLFLLFPIGILYVLFVCDIMRFPGGGGSLAECVCSVMSPDAACWYVVRNPFRSCIFLPDEMRNTCRVASLCRLLQRVCVNDTVFGYGHRNRASASTVSKAISPVRVRRSCPVIRSNADKRGLVIPGDAKPFTHKMLARSNGSFCGASGPSAGERRGNVSRKHLPSQWHERDFHARQLCEGWLPQEGWLYL